MSVKRITAWQVSTGNAYASKSQACHEEMAWLIRTKGDAMKPAIDVANFDRCIEQQQELIAALQDIVPILDTKKDKQILDDLTVLIGRAEAWLTDATQLKENMSHAD
jgi:hypothetical protein